MNVEIFWKDGCPRCPMAKELGKQLKEQGFAVDYHNTGEVSGLTRAMRFGIMSLPAIALVDKNRMMEAWVVNVPTPKEVTEHAQKEE